MLRLRKIIFYILALIYLILCPLMISRMLGFVINPLTHRLVKTGLIYVSTNPPDAFVYVDGRLSPQKTPTAIRDLPPGKHFIRIELSGYNDWEHSVPVVGRKATVLANTLLIPEEWPIQKISQHAYKNIAFADDDILVATNPLLKDIDIFHTTQGIEETIRSENTYEKTTLFPNDSVYKDGRMARLFNEPKSPFILLEVNMKDKTKFLWVNLKEDPAVIEDISDLFTAIPTLVAWDNADNENIFVFYQKNIYRINIQSKAIFPQDAAQLPESLGTQGAPNGQEEFVINDNNDLLTRKGASIRIYPKEAFGSPQVYDIARSRPSTNMYFEEKNGELFYLDADSGLLSTAQILPYRPILNIPIPDSLRNKQ